MPEILYLLEEDNGVHLRRWFPDLESAPAVIDETGKMFGDKKTYLRADTVEWSESELRIRCSTYPHVSYAAGVDPKQIPAAIAKDRANGIKGLEYTKDGDPKYTSPGQRKRHMKSIGLVDKSGFGGIFG